MMSIFLISLQNLTALAPTTPLGSVLTFPVEKRVNLRINKNQPHILIAVKRMKNFTKTVAVLSTAFVLGFQACEEALELEENVPLGQPSLAITSFEPSRGLKLDTLTLYGEGFNPIAYQNRVLFTRRQVRTNFVDENGVVTDSIVVVNEKSSNPAKVVEATSTRLKVIVPSENISISGPVSVIFGIDTVESLEDYVLISDNPRPAIRTVSPVFGAPGEIIIISANYLPTFQPSDSVFVRFGNTIAPSDTIEGFKIFLQVPNLFAGPTDLTVGVLARTNDTLWSAPVNFGVLPSPRAPFTVATYTGRTQLSKGIVGYGRSVDTEEGSFVEIEDYALLGETYLEAPRGVAIDTLKDLFYWIEAGAITNPLTRIVKGKISSTIADETVFTTSLEGYQYFDLALKDNLLFVAGRDIRSFSLGDAGELKPGSNIIWSSGENTSITNLKIVGDNFYWCDNGTKTVYAGQLSGSTLVNVKELYSSQALNDPFAIAVDDLRNTIYISDQGAEGGFIFSGNLSGEGKLEIFYENETIVEFREITDLEMDIKEAFLYFNVPSGIFRKSTSEGNANPVPVYSLPTPKYFDF